MPQDPGLGLPSPSPSAKQSGGLTTDVERPYVEYTLPDEMVSRFFAAKGFDSADLTFRMVEITPAAQDHAAKVASNNPSVLSRELMFAALWMVGTWRGRDNRGKLELWWDAIGAKGRRLVEAAFMSMQSVGEGDVESFLASGRARI